MWILGASWAILATFSAILELPWAILSYLGHLCRNLVTRRKSPDPPGPISGSYFGAQFCSETRSISVLFLGPAWDVFGNPFQGPSGIQKWSRTCSKATPKMEPLSGPPCKAASGRPEPPCIVKTNKKSTFSNRDLARKHPRKDPEMEPETEPEINKNVSRSLTKNRS